MSTNISPENEQVLRDAVNSGQFESVEEALSEALRIFRDQNRNGSHGAMLPSVEWQERFKEHLAATPITQTVFVDDSRESIYEGRGE